MKMEELDGNSDIHVEMAALAEQFEQMIFDYGSSTVNGDHLSSTEAFSLSSGEFRSDLGSSALQDEEDDGSSSALSAEGSSTWPNYSTNLLQAPEASSEFSIKSAWDLKSKTNLSEIELMKEKFAKLLLGEDMSGGGKGVSSALAISNAITNLSASVFGELWKLEPLSEERKSLWRRDMDWLLSVADCIVELVPSWQTLPDGSKFEIMVSRQRSDLHLNLPALRKLDAILLDTLESFRDTEFRYAEHGVMIIDDVSQGLQRVSLHRENEKWWLPTPKVPKTGLSDEGRKRLQHQCECIKQVLKAAVAINTQVLAEMEIPDVYWDALPKNVKASLGESLYRQITTDCFSVDSLLCTLDLSSEHKAFDLANRIEGALQLWRCQSHARNLQRVQRRSKQHNSKTSWGLAKEITSDVERKELFLGRAERILSGLRQKFPCLRQSFLDTTKIQHNRDVGQSILESYSRVIESLAFNIVSRIEDVLYIDYLTKHSRLSAPSPARARAAYQRRGWSHNVAPHTSYTTPFTTPNASPTSSPKPRRTPNSPFHAGSEIQTLSDYVAYS